jgi:hypothetical protein
VTHVPRVFVLILLSMILVLSSNCRRGVGKVESQAIDSTIYAGRAYSVYSHLVVDSVYGGESNPAIIPDDTTIYSPVRIIAQGKTVVLDTSRWWHPHPQIDRYPRLHTSHPSINATYNLAVDILSRCSSGEFMRNAGEEGMWQAGFRRGEGYGVWTRDVCYVGLLMGSFVDEEVAKKSIEFVTKRGIDNGEDGLALPAIAVWNHFVVTGDSSVIRNTYANLEAKIGNIQFTTKRNLGFAHSGSFIDSRRQPEAGGLPLSTNILYAESYRVMARMGAIMNEASASIDLWEQRSRVMKEAINREFWNPDCGYYTFGPKGSESFRNQHWENLGQSLAIWPQWDVADQSKRVTVLENKHVAYNQYGFADLNYLSVPGDEGLHGCEMWVFTEVGEMVAMAKEKQINEVLELLASVIRTATIHKTFQEVVDWPTGKAWRYPGQLWNAMGYISMVYFGVLGMECDEQGVRFPNACVPKPLANMSIDNFKYRDATLSIRVNGWGTFKRLEQDGAPVRSIDPTVRGKHRVEIFMTNGS